MGVKIQISIKMFKFEIHFKNRSKSLTAELIESDLSQQYLDLVKKNYNDSTPVIFDSARYTIEYLRNLAIEAKEKLGLDWCQDVYTLETTTKLHKDIEDLSKDGFSTIPTEFHNLLYDMHFCLHAIENKQVTNRIRDNTITIEWFNDDSIPMPEDFQFQHYLSFGDIKLQNPYVGHPPSMIHYQKDTAMMFQTCCFHDIVKPGIVINISGMFNGPTQMTQDQAYRYQSWWKENCPDFVAFHGMDKIMRYTGYPKIGRIVNLDDLASIADDPALLEIDHLEFY